LCSYATEEYREAHLASEPVKLLLSRLSPGSDAIASAPEIHVFQPSLSYQRPDPTDFSEAQLVILASFGYYKGRTSNALDGWSKIVENCEANEPPVLAYAVLEDKEADTIRTVEVYADAGFASTTHVKSAAVKYNQEQNGSDRDGRKSVVKATPVAGFLGR
jgi:quinol monooxygenase YgiN